MVLNIYFNLLTLCNKHYNTLPRKNITNIRSGLFKSINCEMLKTSQPEIKKNPSKNKVPLSILILFPRVITFFDYYPIF